MKRPGALGPCDFCQSEAYLYPRRGKLSCRGCAELGVAPGRLNALPTKRNREEDLSENPLSQPAQASSGRKIGNCVYCGYDCENWYPWQNTFAYACGWGHAGFWMDAQIAELEARHSLLGEA